MRSEKGKKSEVIFRDLPKLSPGENFLSFQASTRRKEEKEGR